MFLDAIIKGFEFGSNIRIKNQTVTVCVLRIFKFFSSYNMLPVVTRHASYCIFLFVSAGMPDKTNLTDVKQIHQTNDGSTLDTTGAGCTAMANYMTFMLISLVILILNLW